MRPRRVLVVEDHESFRRAICTLLAQRPDLEIVGEAANGLDAVRRAEALQPDLVTLDIGLPGLAGLEITSRLAAVAPDARILLVTNEWASAVIEEAFRRGAHGYVYKLRVARDLLRAVDVVVGGGRFSGGLERIARGGGLASHRHDLLFYSSDAAFGDSAVRFVARALQQESAVIMVVTGEHRESLRHRLPLEGVDVERAAREGRYVTGCIGQILSEVMVDGQPDLARFLNASRGMIAEAAQGADGRRRNVAVLGEVAPVVWGQGQLEATLQLEHVWDEMVKEQPVDTLCAFPLDARDVGDARMLRRLCATHTTVEIS